MRITQRMIIDSAVYRLQQNQEGMDKLRADIASSKRIRKPDDDPQGTHQAMNLRTHLSAVQNSLRNLEYSMDWLSANDAALGSIAKVLAEARDEALKAANDTLSSGIRQGIVPVIRDLYSQTVGIGNTEHRGQHIFGGFRVDQPPFVADMNNLTFTYQGDNGSISHEVEPGTQVVVNVPGSDPLFSAALTALKNLHDALQANDTAAIRASVADIDNALDLTLQKQGEIGSRVKGVSVTRSRLEKYEVDIQSLLSRTENVDVAEAVLNLSSHEQAYQATLSALSRILPFTSLFDYVK
ncbi:MAG: flagellar hook-associated protein FlgL [Anaerolineae bacterium]|nr:flagellar hook-associated protein FlgL [Anaerolineae bacterium]